MFEAFAPIVEGPGAALAGAGIASLLIALLLSPWLTGMVVASIRAGDTLRFGNLLQFGLREYGRMARMLLWARRAARHRVRDLRRRDAIGREQAGRTRDPADRRGQRVAHRDDRAGGVVFVLAHATVEAGRGMLAADPSQRSAVKAWWRGMKLLVRRPVAVLVVYLGTLLAGEGLALALGFARTQRDRGERGRIRDRPGPGAVGGRGDRLGPRRPPVRHGHPGPRRAAPAFDAACAPRGSGGASGGAPASESMTAAAVA